MALSPDERRARDAERKRRTRAAARAVRDAARAKTKDKTDASAPRTMRDAVESALAAMKWLMPSDDGSVAQARMLAEDVDLLRHAGETVKALSAQGRLTTVLAALGGAPAVRLQHELRSLRLKSKAGKPKTGDGDDGSDEEPAANVTKFERPKKRRRTS